MTRRGGAFAPPLPTAPSRPICGEHSIPAPIAERDAAAEAVLLAEALATDLEALASQRWAPEPRLLRALAQLGGRVAVQAEAAARGAA